MSRASRPAARLERRAAWYRAVRDAQGEPRNAMRWLPEVRRWQAQRLRRSLAPLLERPDRAAAADFFLGEVYGGRDDDRRDADMLRVVPTMARLLPAPLAGTLAHAIELGVLSHALDLRMAEALHGLAPRRRRLDEALYAEAYREVGRPRLRGHQIDLIGAVGDGLADAVALPGAGRLLRMSRPAARLAGVGRLQDFLERGYAAFEGLDDPQGFVEAIQHGERALSRRLFANAPRPFG
ncbi:hypothetical protein LDO32_10045 [Luteimonas sp. Y-2-2-4F]|nr:hypothetical protein [Luteimonas sp. Y-2-2-4F]MCD9032061.1 hypothetical protein [Luteimonas sp. Y-2-2-4F]